jgi:AMMECR1 domain-containing protein
MISIDVLQTPVPVASPEELDPKKYGVIVRSGPRTGLLLPDLEGIDRVDEQLSIAKSKAGIGPDEPCSLEKFTVVRYL